MTNSNQTKTTKSDNTYITNDYRIDSSAHSAIIRTYDDEGQRRVYSTDLLLSYVQVKIFLSFNVSLPLQFHYTLFQPTRIELHPWGLQWATNATIRRQKADYQVEGFQHMKRKAIQCAPCNNR